MMTLNRYLAMRELDYALTLFAVGFMTGAAALAFVQLLLSGGP